MEDPTDFSIFVKDNEKWSQTESVSLISSFVVSLLVGTYAPIDFSDGSGMNVLDIKGEFQILVRPQYQPIR